MNNDKRYNRPFQLQVNVPRTIGILRDDTRILIRIYAYTYTHIRIYLYAYYAHVLVNVYLRGTVADQSSYRTAISRYW